MTWMMSRTLRTSSVTVTWMSTVFTRCLFVHNDSPLVVYLCPKWVLQPFFSAAQFFQVKYLQIRGGDLLPLLLKKCFVFKYLLRPTPREIFFIFITSRSKRKDDSCLPSLRVFHFRVPPTYPCIVLSLVCYLL